MHFWALARRRAACAGLSALLIGLLSGVPPALGQGASRPAGPPAPIRVWTSDIHDNDLRAPAGGAAPSISIVGARNGAFSGKVMVGSDAPIVGLRGTMSDLKGEAATPAGGKEPLIPAANALVRYGVEWDGGIPAVWQGVPGADILLEAPPATFPPIGGKSRVPVWVTVNVPKDARPGAYSGTLTVEATASKPVTVPVRLDIQDWTLPDAQDYRVWAGVIQQPDTLAAEFDLPLWSEKHWEMIARSLRLIAPTGSRVVYIPLICRTNHGSEQTMVRWIRRPDGTYEHDYSIMEKYLDVVGKELGEPKIVAFIVWDIYLSLPRQPTTAPIEIKGREGSWEWKETSFARALQERAGKGPFVSVLDPATKKTETVILPRYEDPNARDLWRPLWEGVRARMKARGLEGTMMLAQLSDRWPNREEVALWNNLAGGLPWVSCSHHPRWPVDSNVTRGQLYGIATVGCADVALSFFFNLNPAKGRYYGWREPMLRAQYWRFGFFNASTLPTIRHEAEVNITGKQRGVGHIGGDFWPCFRNKAGKRTGTVTDRYVESYWHSLNVEGWLLAPGPAGPVGTARLEVFREGLQECEARIAIESALIDPAHRARLGQDLARRAEETLDERLRCIWKARGATDADFQKHGLVDYRTYGYDLAKAWEATRGPGHTWFLSSGWAERAGRLFATAGEVARKLGQ